MIRFHAHGKLLLSAEYMVMHGSTAMAIPLKQGQSLEVSHTGNNHTFTWNAVYNNVSWFEAIYDPGNLKILDTSDMGKAMQLKKIIQACIEITPEFQQSLFRKDALTILDFSPEYGFGSSSTLIALLADWAEINPLDLHFMVSEGSGYDVACAVAEGPITYKLRDHGPHYQHIAFHPPFSEQLWFAWLGNKQPTESHLLAMSGKINPNFETRHKFTELTNRMIEASTLKEFQALMETHEQELSALLGMESISSTLKDLPGAVKSLGAWGGDFIMIASEAERETLVDYLKKKGIRILFSYKDLVYEKEES